MNTTLNLKIAAVALALVALPSFALACGEVDLDIVKEKKSPETVRPGDVIVYTVTVKNTLSGKASVVTVTDPIPAGLTFNAAASSKECKTQFPSHWPVTNLQNKVECRVSPGKKVDSNPVTFTIAFNIASNLKPDQCVIKNIAKVTAIEQITGKSSETVTTTIENCVPTPTPTPTSKPTPTPTVTPTATPTPTPTATPTSTPTTTPTSASTPTPTPVAQVKAAHVTPKPTPAPLGVPITAQTGSGTAASLLVALAGASGLALTRRFMTKNQK